MATISKEIRERVWNKYGCRCAYCGETIEYKQMQVDHIMPHWHKITDAECERQGIKRGLHDEINFNPACSRCNKWKATFTIEQFRREIQSQISRLNAYSSNYRMAKSYGLITETEIKVKFFFETVTP